MAPIRLLWLLDSLGPGGAEGLVRPFARRLDRSRYELYVAAVGSAPSVGIEDDLRAAGVTLFHAGARNLRDIAAFRRLADFVRRERIDLVHAHLTYSAIWSSVLARATGVPSVASLHVAPSATKQLRKNATYRAAVAARDALMRFLLNRWSSRVILVSDALRKTYVAAGLDPGRAVVVHNGIQVERFARDRAETRARIERELSIPPGAPIAIAVSVLRPAKGIEVLLEAVHRVPGTYFVIVGDGPLAGELKALAEAKGAGERVRWAGFRGDVGELLAGCDLFVHPSLDDAFPTVLLEAMAAGLPVVASHVGGIPEIVAPGVTGTLVPPGDAERLAGAMAALLGDRAAMEAMREQAQQIAAARFSTEAWLSRLEAVYADVLQQFGTNAAVAPSHD